MPKDKPFPKGDAAGVDDGADWPRPPNAPNPTKHSVSVLLNLTHINDPTCIGKTLSICVQ